MANVEHAIGAEITANSTLIGLHGVGRAKDGAHTGNNAGTGKNEGYNGAGLHECGELREQGLAVNHKINDVAVVLTQNGVVQLHHLHTAQMEPLCKQTLQNGTGKVLAYAVRLKKNQCFFVAHNKISVCVTINYTAHPSLVKSNVIDTLNAYVSQRFGTRGFTIYDLQFTN